MLTSRVHPQTPPDAPSAEDIFSSALTTIFPDDTVNSHGDPGSYVTYRSPNFGDIKLLIPKHPDEEAGRKLFAHHLWNAGVLVAEAIEVASQDKANGPIVVSEKEGGRDEDVDSGNDQGKAVWDRLYWGIRNQNVLELGADHPSSPALTANAISLNIKANLKPPLPETISVYGYSWGTSTFYSPDTYGKPISPASNYDKIIIADCLWMPSQHINLIKTILTFLPPLEEPEKSIPPDQNEDPKTMQQPCALVVAGFHTGRSIVASFFSLATEPPDPSSERPVDPPWKPYNTEDSLALSSETEQAVQEDLTPEEQQYVGKLKLAEIFEVDVDLNTRPWQPVREGESKWDAKRWCVVGMLVQR